MARKPFHLAPGALVSLMLLTPNWVASQSASPSARGATGALNVPGAPAKEALIVLPDGRLAKPSRPPVLRLQTEVLDKSEHVGDLLGRHGLADDAKTREMLRKLNPKYDFSRGFLAAGSKVDVFTIVPESDRQTSTTAKFTFDTPNLASYAFYTQAARASEIFNTAGRLPPGAFADPSLAKVHVQSANDIRRAAETLQTRADKLSRLDYAVAQYQVEYASRQAAALNAKGERGMLPDDEVRAVAVSAKGATQMSERVAAGRPPSEWRTVRVNVYKGNSTDHVRPLQVYVLPSGALERPDLWNRSQLESFLVDFSFTNDASPVSQAVPTDFDPRVCVGPKNAASGMARLIAERKLNTCRKPPSVASGSTQVEVTFRAPDDVAKP